MCACLSVLHVDGALLLTPSYIAQLLFALGSSERGAGADPRQSQHLNDVRMDSEKLCHTYQYFIIILFYHVKIKV